MKLILATNQSEKFVEFYRQLRQKSGDIFDYSAYRGLLFYFNYSAKTPITVIDTASGKSLTDYDGIYINGYMHDYELAAATAICCDRLGIPFVNSEMKNPVSLSKLTEYAKLAAAGLPVPRTYAGTKRVLTAHSGDFADIFPAVLKRADADRGIDNFLVEDEETLRTQLETYDEASVWILQEYIANDGFYRIGYHGSQASFVIFRSLEQRPDGNRLKAHMYKPKGGRNASSIPLHEVPERLLAIAAKSMQVMGRHIGGVDCLYNPETGVVTVLEVNYNPQLVTVETFADVRQASFIEYLRSKW